MRPRRRRGQPDATPGLRGDLGDRAELGIRGDRDGDLAGLGETGDLRDPGSVPTIEVTGLTRSFLTGGTQVDALVDVDLRVDRGEFVAVMGSSGSGKSTLMNILGCLDTPTAGRYVLDGTDVATLRGAAQARVRNRTIGFVFQSFNLVPRTSAVTNVELPLMYAGVPRRQRRRLALEALAMVGLSDRADHTPTQLSGGQQQRVAVARAVVSEPALLLADEPTGNLDSRSTHDVLRVLAELHDEGRTVVVITHEHDVAGWAGRTVVMHDGRVVSDEAQVPRRPAAWEPVDPATAAPRRRLVAPAAGEPDARVPHEAPGTVGIGPGGPP
ncbi:ABC transporter ATP-binding protein [Aquipuribacter hungaricus]|uniref:ABC transporter ATP-binding protein n=1 Tax=Aquipuribacter hungaricus TaxID=545624 RepID=A0ABV7WMN6_9MICO